MVNTGQCFVQAYYAAKRGLKKKIVKQNIYSKYIFAIRRGYVYL